MENTIKTVSELKAAVEAAGNCPYFFTRDTMRFFGDTIHNYGVRAKPVLVDTWTRKGVLCWELYRKRPVKRGLQSSAYFDCKTFAKVVSKKE